MYSASESDIIRFWPGKPDLVNIHSSQCNKKSCMHLPQSSVPGSEPDLFWIFLHSVLVVDVQFLTFSSPSAHLIRREAK